jgi:hypothetical protein
VLLLALHSDLLPGAEQNADGVIVNPDEALRTGTQSTTPMAPSQLCRPLLTPWHVLTQLTAIHLHQTLGVLLGGHDSMEVGGQFIQELAILTLGLEIAASWLLARSSTTVQVQPRFPGACHGAYLA